MPVRTHGVKTSPTRTARPGLLIVARDHLALYRAIARAFGDSPQITVFLDRRCENRRQRGLAVPADRRHMERRSLSRIEDDLSVRKYVLVRPHYRRPSD
jgi:hypothetical protein